ncbi:hypothetical protein GMSM_44740 [Geomonas sp. Red276]
MKKHIFNDPVSMPGSSQPPEDIYASAEPLAGTPGDAYVLHRGIEAGIAAAFGVRYHDDFGGRPAVLVPLHDRDGNLTSVHGRYLSTTRLQDKMFTVGRPGGVISLPDSWRADPLIVVEGLFDALSLAASGWNSVATIGRHVPWLTEASRDRVVWAAFDAGRPGEANAQSYQRQLFAAEVRRLPPPPRCKDWNTALVKRGREAVSKWVTKQLAAAEAMG